MRTINEITPVQLSAKLTHAPLTLVDVRTPGEFEICSLHHALLIPLAELPQRIDELDPNDDIVVYCHHGIRSMSAAAILQNAGFPRVQSLAGGIERWSLEVDPSVPRY